MAINIGPSVIKNIFVDVAKPTFKGHPQIVDEAIRCPECRRILVITSPNKWGCPASLSHCKTKTTKIITLEALQAIGTTIMGNDEVKSVARLMRLLRQRSNWMSKLGAKEEQIDQSIEVPWLVKRTKSKN